jgi:hypothetical protein
MMSEGLLDGKPKASTTSIVSKKARPRLRCQRNAAKAIGSHARPDSKAWLAKGCYLCFWNSLHASATVLRT